MEFEGRITKVLPVRSGTTQNGEWKRLPFIFAYYEQGEQRMEDSVLLDTWDTGIMSQIAAYCQKGTDGKVIIENGCMKLRTLDIKCRVGFYHRTKTIQKNDGSAIINELRCYKIEFLPSAIPMQQLSQSPIEAQPEPLQHITETDDLPF